ncbi:unnamed protein product [Chilo suppressalis]|uniref:THIF-type NAD/FAD binding fold domain-containing protein n=1 Tax=Chilo suppressalis TaxID=168631 RepID=A0ABN8EBB2_CHISP|nr:unnamed protein product [Chilo suppressalis]
MDRVTVLEEEIANLRMILQQKEAELYELKKECIRESHAQLGSTNHTTPELNNLLKTHCSARLPKWAIVRYSRQILLPDIGVKGQEKLCSARVLVVGAGGLGCPAAVYLAGAGVGDIGIVDYDDVEITNIHRQILHSERDECMSKAESAAHKLRSINSHIKVTPYNVQLDSSNAVDIASGYDVVLDCTDNVPTRYLLNDLCVMTGLPLISGSALKMEGQLTIYGYRADRNCNEKNASYRGPCYRCIFPTPPPPQAVGSCSANGVAGPVPGVIGTLQALEAIKMIVGLTHEKMLIERMLLFDGEDMTFKIVNLRGQNQQCAVCSQTPSITRLIDYEAFCKSQAKEKPITLPVTERRRVEKQKRMTGKSYYGFRKTDRDKRAWVQDVPKSERKIGPPCSSDLCQKGTARHCNEFDEEARKEMFRHFWHDLDWKGKRDYVKTLVDVVPPKRRRKKDAISRKGDSKLYHLRNKGERLLVCRLMFLNTLGLKEAMLRSWLTCTDKPRSPKKPLKSLNVDSYIDALPVCPPKCEICRNSCVQIRYLNLSHVKNIYQLYVEYMKEMKSRNISPASRKTFCKVVSLRNLRVFKPKNENDVCDLVSQHNAIPSYSYQNVDIGKEGLNHDMPTEYFYGEDQLLL